MPQVESVLNTADRHALRPLRAADFERIFDQDLETALRGALARDLEADGATLYRNAGRQARTQQDMGLGATFRDRAKEFQGQRMTRKQAE
ncbi:hypothetical protein [Pseudomonas sp. BR20]|uniref:hypothetical protein n=1 Tax=Pseudomonas sp. BR20 TaxID=3137452 RepID=UPI003D6F35A2